MKWLKKLKDWNISFQVHELQKEDFIVLQPASGKQNAIYILDGVAQLMQVFTNKEKICIKLLLNNQVAINYGALNQSNYCNTVLAITKTKIITAAHQEIWDKLAKDTDKFAQNVSYIPNEQYEITNILSHRNTKKRIVQLLIILIKQFGEITGRKITIPFNLSHQAIADITGSQRITVNKIMSKLKSRCIINYGNKSIIIHNLAELIRD